MLEDGFSRIMENACESCMMMVMKRPRKNEFLEARGSCGLGTEGGTNHTNCCSYCHIFAFFVIKNYVDSVSCMIL